MKEDVAKLRTFAIISHGGAGKTSLAEAMLFDAGVTTRLGKVDDGTSVMDYEPEEVKRKITITTAFNTLAWKKHQLNIIDTPGDFNFIAETKTSMQGADAALVIVDGIDGVRVQTEKVWEFANEFGQPRVIFVSKMDKERADFAKTVEDIRNNFGKSCIPLMVPIGAAENLKGVVDILSRKAYLYNQGDSGKFEVQDVPAELAEQVARYREELTEGVAESSDELLEKYLEGTELTPEEILDGLRKAVVSGKLVPIVGGSGPMNIGIQPLMDVIVDYLPSPLDRGARQFDAVGDKDAPTREPDPAAPLAALVIKTVSDPYAGRLSILRIFSGKLSPDSNVFNASKRAKERFGQLLRLKGKSQDAIEYAGPGDIVAVAKLKETVTGDTLCDEKASVLIPCSGVAAGHLFTGD